MRIQLLGTGSLYSKSNCAGLIIDSHILVDIGPGTVKKMIQVKYDLLDIDTILITHLHADHILDFALLVANIEVLKDKHTVYIFGPKGTKEKIKNLLNAVYDDYYDSFMDQYFCFIDIYDHKKIEIRNYKVNVIEVVHPGIESYGFVIDDTLGITGDSALCKGIEKICRGSHTIICDCSLIEGDIYHMGIDDIQNLSMLYKEREFVLTHYRDITRDALSHLSLNHVVICDDGYTFDV